MRIELSELSVGYKSIPILAKLNFQFSSGGLNLILGPSGSGKTSLLLTICGFLIPISGKIIFYNTDSPVNELPQASIAFQNPENMFFLATAGEEITFGLLESGIDSNESIKKGKQWLEAWGLNPESFWEKPPFFLSGGEKRRLALATATVLRPDVILLDEPLSGLDPISQKKILATLGKLSEDSLVLTVTHDIENLLPLAKSVSLIHGKDYYSFDCPVKFIKAVLAKPELYPLPDWYLQLTPQFSSEVPPPWPNIQSIKDYFRNMHEKKIPGE
ncbi:MAG: ATP-binding cassette domain-containing protein [Candidatus Riflebacteria bacterium]|nr:ATP-binding cassette domain-containing protein [Candidatus Riflebacteria bacterium]